MGGGASIEEHRGTVTSLITGKPSDASDVTNLEQARAEIRQLRAMALQVQDRLKDMSQNAAAKDATATGGGKVKREAVMDRGGGGGTPAANYVPPVVEKSDDIKKLIMSIVTTNENATGT